MANSSTPLLPGYLNPAHQSNLTAFYPDTALPTPWPLVLASSLVSIITAFVGLKSSGTSWLPRSERTRIDRERKDKKTWLERYREAKAARARGVHLPVRSFAEQDAEDDEAMEREMAESPEVIALGSSTGPGNHFAGLVRVYGTFIYTTLRAVVALCLTIKVMVSKHGTFAAPSSLLTLLLSVQTFLANRSIPRLASLIVLLNALCVSTAFLISVWMSGPGISRYGELTIQGGPCAQYAWDCIWQTSRWDHVGCGPKIVRQQRDDDVSFFTPYGYSEDSGSSFNVLSTVELVIGVGGSIWMITVLLTVWEARNIRISSWQDLMRPIERAAGQIHASSSNRIHIGWNLVIGIAFLGFFGTFAVSIVSIVASVVQATRPHYTTYLDGVGPLVPVANLSNLGDGGVKLGYGGNSTSWSDCFVLQAPTFSQAEFWSLYIKRNEESLFRIAAFI